MRLQIKKSTPKHQYQNTEIHAKIDTVSITVIQGTQSKDIRF